MREVCAFYIFQNSIGNMEFELSPKRSGGVVAMGVAVDEQAGKVFEFGDIFYTFNLAGDEDIEEVPFLFVCKVGIEPVEHF